MIRQKQVFIRLSQYCKLSSCRHLHFSYCLCLRKAVSSRRLSEVQSPQAVAGEYRVQPNFGNKLTNSNFYGIESEEGVIHITEKSQIKNINDCFLKKPETNEPIEMVKITSFGAIRLDSENKVVRHGQYENSDASNLPDFEVYPLSRQRKPLIHNKVDETDSLVLEHNLNNNVTKEYINESTNSLDTYLDIKSPHFEESSCKINSNTANGKDSVSFFDECYFGNDTKNLENTDVSKKLPDSQFAVETPDLNTHSQNIVNANRKISEVSFVDKSYFGDDFLDSLNVSKSTDSQLEKLDCTNELNISKNKEHCTNYKDPNVLTEKDEIQLNFSKTKNITISPSDENLSYIDKTYFINAIPDKIAAEKQANSSNIVKLQEMNTNEENISSESISKNKFEKAYDSSTSHKEMQNATDNESIKMIYHNSNGKQIEDVVNNTYFTPGITQESVVSIKARQKPVTVKNHSLSNSAYLGPKNNFLFKKESVTVNRIDDSLNLSSESLSESNVKWRPEIDDRQIKEKSAKLSENQKGDLNKKISHENKVKVSDKTESAYEFVKTVRQEKKLTHQPYKGGIIKPTDELVDSKGFRVLKNQVPNLRYFTRDEVLKLLVENVIYSDEDVIVLNKPYSLVIHESNTTKDACLSSYLDDLAVILDKKSDKPELHTVHRLDKETTGCLLLARNEISAQRLKSLFIQRKIIKTYWIVTIKVPDPPQGIIDIPISEGTVDTRSRMVLHPVVPKEIEYKSHSKHGKRAVTQYTVISESGNAALVEVRPETGIKHQIRVHFGLSLSCPILGDHKYTYLDKLVPQKLPADLLQRLHVRQSKARHIPMHIYARSILIPQYKDGKNLYVSAPLPLHISTNLQRLKFKKKNSRKMYLGEPID